MGALVAIGRVGRPHGLAGAFAVAGRHEPLPGSYRELWIGPSPEVARCTKVRWTRLQGDRVVVCASLASDRTAAESLTGQTIYVAAAVARAGQPSGGPAASRSDGAGDLLWGDLVGAEVEDQAGRPLGRVHHVYNAGASDVVEVRRPLGDGAGEETVDIPLVPPFWPEGARLVASRLRLGVQAEDLGELWTRRQPSLPRKS